MILFQGGLHLAIQSPATSTLSQKHLSTLARLVSADCGRGISDSSTRPLPKVVPSFLRARDRSKIQEKRDETMDAPLIRYSAMLARRQDGLRRSVVQTATISSRILRLKNSPVRRSRVIEHAAACVNVLAAVILSGNKRPSMRCGHAKILAFSLPSLRRPFLPCILSLRPLFSTATDNNSLPSHFVDDITPLDDVYLGASIVLFFFFPAHPRSIVASLVLRAYRKYPWGFKSLMHPVDYGSCAQYRLLSSVAFTFAGNNLRRNLYGHFYKL